MNRIENNVGFGGASQQGPDLSDQLFDSLAADAGLDAVISNNVDTFEAQLKQRTMPETDSPITPQDSQRLQSVVYASDQPGPVRQEVENVVSDVVNRVVKHERDHQHETGRGLI